MPHRDLAARRKYNREYQQRRYAARRAKLLLLFGNRCQHCGGDENLEFDHKDAATKVTPLSSLLGSSSWETILVEAGKCQLLCADCHDVKGTISGERPSSLTVGMVRQVRQDTRSHREIAAAYDITIRTVQNIKQNLRWKWVS